MAGLSAGSGLLIGIVGIGKGCAGGGAMVLLRARTGKVVRAFGGPVKRVALPRGLPSGDLSVGEAQDEHESLILAQNERWRHA